MSYPVPSAPIISGSTRPARRLGAALALCAAALLASGCEILSLGERQPEPVRDEAAPEARGPPYDVAFSGLEDIGLEGLFRQTSQLIALAERPPATQAGLRRRAEEDLERLRSVLRSEGYYAGTLGYEIDTTAEPQIVHIEAEPRALQPGGGHDQLSSRGGGGRQPAARARGPRPGNRHAGPRAGHPRSPVKIDKLLKKSWLSICKYYRP